jgi:hypothetical protein
MKLAASITRSLQADLQAELRDIEGAVSRGSREAGLTMELRRQVGSAGLRHRLANALRSANSSARAGEPGTHANGALMAQVVLSRAVSFADDFAGARAYAGVSATAEAVLDVHRNGSPIGTITFGIGASTGAFATAGGGAETFAAGDRLAIINENPADATLADLSITFLGKRT